MIYKNQNLKKLRKDVKKIGFNFRKKSYSEFSTLEFFHIETKKIYSDCMTKESVLLFETLTNYLEGV